MLQKYSHNCREKKYIDNIFTYIIKGIPQAYLFTDKNTIIFESVPFFIACVELKIFLQNWSIHANGHIKTLYNMRFYIEKRNKYKITFLFIDFLRES